MWHSTDHFFRCLSFRCSTKLLIYTPISGLSRTPAAVSGKSHKKPLTFDHCTACEPASNMLAKGLLIYVNNLIKDRMHVADGMPF